MSCSSHSSSSAPCAASSSTSGCSPANPGQPDEPLVDARVVLHRAPAERIEARVDPEVARRERREVAQHLGLGELGQARRRRAPMLARAARGPAGRAWALPRPRRPGLRLLVDQLHAPSASASRSISSTVRFSVTATSSASSRPGVVAAERIAGVDPVRPRRRERLAGVAARAHRELLERVPLGERQLEPRARRGATSRSPSAPCMSPPARAAPRARAGSGARAPRARAASGWS